MLTLGLVLAPALLAQAATADPAARSQASIARGHGAQCAVVGFTAVPTARHADRKTTERSIRGGPRFSAAQTLDVRLEAVPRRGALADAILELRVYTPRGHLYQTVRALPAAVGASGGKAAPWTAVLPLAGTSIVNSSLYGQWRVEPHLDGSLRPCGPAERFWVGP